MQRYFLNQPFEDNVTINDKDIVHHLKNVMKNHVGEEMCLVTDGQAKIYKIDTIDNDAVSLSFVCDEAIKRELSVNLTVATPFLKKDNFELAIQKMTECGVTNIIPTDYQRSVIKVDDKKLAKKYVRYDQIIKSASMQSKRNIIPTLSPFTKLKNIDFSSYDLVITCYEDELTKHITKCHDQIIKASNILVVIGPEGGLDQHEIELLNQLDNNQTVSLGNRILRSETAQITTVYYLSTIIEGGL